MKKIMILGGSEAQLPAILKAKELGYLTFNVDMYDDAFCKEYADEFENISTLDFDGLCEAIEKHKPDGIMTIASDRPVPILAKLAEKYGFIAVNTESATKATNKYLMRETFNKTGVAIPRFSKITCIEELYKNIDAIGFPAILKPVDSSGSRGISYIDINTDLENAYHYSKAAANSGTLLLEEYMIGEEYSVESFTEKGETIICAITEKSTTGKPHFIETGHVVPAELDYEKTLKIKELVLKAHKALKVNCGPSHTEVMYTESGPKIVEIGLRMGGDCISSFLVPLATSIDLVGLTIKQALGDSFEIGEDIHKSACIRFILNSQSKNIRGIDMSGVKCVHYYVDKSKLNKQLNSSADRIGYVICSGENHDQSVEKAESALNDIKFIY